MARRPLRVGSTFSGVGGADLGLERAGFQLVWTCEWDDWKRSVLAAHWPDIPHYTDVRDLADLVGLDNGSNGRAEGGADGHAPITGKPCPVDLLVGGFPCQDLSVAGKRRGFDGERSVLAFEFLRIAESIRPRWLLMENVPGLLSSNGGRDLARLLDELGAIGYGWAYRILDARFFGVPQRRRRIFVCAYRADADVDSGTAAKRALRALWEGSGGDPTPGWPPRALTPDSVGTGTKDGGRIVGALSAQGYQRYTDQELIGQGQLVTHEDVPDVAHTITRRHHKGTNSTADDGALIVYAEPVARTVCTQSQDGQSTTYVVNALDRQQDRQDMTYMVNHPVGDVVSTLQGSGGSPRGQRNDAEGAAGGHLIPQRTFSVYPESGNGADITAAEVDRSPALTKVKSERGVHVAERTSVRRLTPLECERLMGWGQIPCNEKCGCGEPHGWTAPPGIKAPDSKRYAACGDGIVSWVAYWIGCRIQMIEDETA